MFIWHFRVWFTVAEMKLCACSKTLPLPLLYQPGAKMVTASKATVPTISDQASAMQLSQCAKNLASALAELRTASQKVMPIFIYCYVVCVIYTI